MSKNIQTRIIFITRQPSRNNLLWFLGQNNNTRIREVLGKLAEISPEMPETQQQQQLVQQQLLATGPGKLGIVRIYSNILYNNMKTYYIGFVLF